MDLYEEQPPHGLSDVVADLADSLCSNPGISKGDGGGELYGALYLKYNSEHVDQALTPILVESTENPLMDRSSTFEDPTWSLNMTVERFLYLPSPEIFVASIPLCTLKTYSEAQTRFDTESICKFGDEMIRCESSNGQHIDISNKMMPLNWIPYSARANSADHLKVQVESRKLQLRLKNRESVMKCRLKKSIRFTKLRAEENDLINENEKMKHLLDSLEF